MGSKSIFVIVIILSMSTNLFAFTLTGTEHMDISQVTGDGYLYDYSSADILPGGNLYAAYIYDQAGLSFNGGWTDRVYTYNSSAVDMFSGETRALVGYGNSTMNIYGGRVGIAGNGGALVAYDNSTVNVSGGKVGGCRPMVTVL